MKRKTRERRKITQKETKKENKNKINQNEANMRSGRRPSLKDKAAACWYNLCDVQLMDQH